MVTMIIARELGLEDRYLAEEIKKYPLAKVESLFHLRHEDGSVQFFSTPLPPAVFARVCVVKADELVPLPGDLALEKCAPFAAAPKSGSLSPTPCARCVRSAPPATFAIFRSWCWSAVRRWISKSRSWSPMRWRTTAWLPDGETFAAARAPKRGGHRPDSLGIRSLRMNGNHSAPAIAIAVIDGCDGLWREVLLGIEEEGIPFRLQHHPAGEVVDSAWQAARSSPLLVGIACDRHTLVVHYKNLPASAPLLR